MVLLEKFHKWINTEICDALPGSINQALISSLRDFCKHTQVWEIDIESIPMEAEIDEVTLCEGENIVILNIISMCHNNAQVRPFLSGCSLPVSGNQIVYYVSDKRSSNVKLLPVPMGEVISDLEKIKVAVMPRHDATEVGDILYDEYGEEIATGALAILQSQKSKPWYDPDMAFKNSAIFKSARAMARIDVMRNYSHAHFEDNRARLSGAP